MDEPLEFSAEEPGNEPTIVWSEEIHPEHHHPAVVQALQDAEVLSQLASLVRNGDQAYASGGDVQEPKIPETVKPILAAIDQWAPKSWVPQDPNAPTWAPPEAPWVSATPIRTTPLPAWDPQMARLHRHVKAQGEAFAYHPNAQRLWRGVTQLVVTAARLDAQDRQFQRGEREMPITVPEPLTTDAWISTLRDAQIEVYLQMSTPSEPSLDLADPAMATPSSEALINPVIAPDASVLKALGVEPESPGPSEPALAPDEDVVTPWQVGKLNTTCSLAWQTDAEGAITWWTDSTGAPATFPRADQAVAAIRATGAGCEVLQDPQHHEAWVPKPVRDAWIQAQITYAVAQDRQLAAIPTEPAPVSAAPSPTIPPSPTPSPVLKTVLQAVNAQYAIGYQVWPNPDREEPRIVFVPNPDARLARNGVAAPQKFELALADNPGVRQLWAKQHQITWVDQPVDPIDHMPPAVKQALTAIVQTFQQSPVAPAVEPAPERPWQAFAQDANHWALFRMKADRAVEWAQPQTATPGSTVQWFTQPAAEAWYAKHGSADTPLTPITQIAALPVAVAAPLTVATRALGASKAPSETPSLKASLSLTPPSM